MKCELEDALHPHPREEDHQRPRHAAAAGEGRPGRQAAADHRRGRRERSAGDPGRQQAPRRARTSAPSRPPASATAARPCSATSPSSPAAQFISEDLGLKLENVDARAARPGQDRSASTRKHARIIQGAGKKADIQKRIDQIRRQMEQTESEYDKEKFQRAAGEADRRRGDHPRRRGDRGRDEADEGPRRGRPARHPRRGRRGHRPRRRHGPAPRASRPSRSWPRSSRATRSSAPRSSLRALEKPIRTIAENSGHDGAVVADEVTTRGEKNAEHRLSTPTPASTSTCSRPASSTRPRSPARPCRTPPASPGLMLTTEVMITKIDEDDKKSRVTGSIA